MNVQTAEQIKKVVDIGGKNFKGLKLPEAVFEGRDLKNADFRGCTLTDANFKGCNLTYANFEGANCIGADFTDAICHRTNFKDANLSSSKMHCKDMFGCTFTLVCKSFQDVDVAPGWWAGWLYYGLLMKSPSPEHKEKLIQAMGIERWEVLRSQYANRQW